MVYKRLTSDYLKKTTYTFLLEATPNFSSCTAIFSRASIYHRKKFKEWFTHQKFFLALFNDNFTFIKIFPSSNTLVTPLDFMTGTVFLRFTGHSVTHKKD